MRTENLIAATANRARDIQASILPFMAVHAVVLLSIVFGGSRLEADGVQLALDSLDDIWMAVAQARYRSTAGGIQILLAFTIVNISTFAANGGGWLTVQVPVENVGHGTGIIVSISSMRLPRNH